MTKLSIYVISAMCANFWSESTMSPGIYESLYKFDGWTYVWQNVGGKGTGGYGLGQWTNTNGDSHGRLYKLHEYLSSNGYANDSMEGQLSYVEVEGHWAKGTSWQKEVPYNSLSDFLTSDSTDLNELTKAWLYCWEGIRSDTLSTRQTNAQNIYDYIVKNKDKIPTSYYSENNYLSIAQRYSNALYIYNVLSNGDVPTPEPPAPTKKRKGMPVWMMVRYRV